MNDWYDENIERGVRNLVRLLRNNGWNTISSCEHNMSVTMEWYGAYEPEHLVEFLQAHGYDEFAITAHMGVLGERRVKWLRVDLNEYSPNMRPVREDVEVSDALEEP